MALQTRDSIPNDLAALTGRRFVKAAQADNRPKAANAIREDLDRALLLISVWPEVGAQARNVT